MTEHSIIATTRNYIQENFLYARRDVTLTDDEHLFDRGIVDSLGVAEMVAFVEQEFSIAVADEDVTERNFCTVRAIASYIMGKQINPVAA